MVYLLDGIVQITGYYLLLPDNFEQCCSLIRCAHPPEGYLRVLKVINSQIMIVPAVTNQMDLDSNMNPNAKLTSDNYYKDLQVCQYYNCDYVTYMNDIIDALIDNENQGIADHEQRHDNNLIEQVKQHDVPNMTN